MKKPRQLRAYIALTWYALRAQTRNPATFAFGFIFPIVFISIFGLIGGSTPKITIGIPPEVNEQNVIVQGIKSLPHVEIKKEAKEELDKKLQTGKLAAILQIEETGANQWKTQLTTSQAMPQEAGAATALISSLVDKTNLKLSGVTAPPITLEISTVSGRAQRYIDFALPGQIGFSLLSTAVFGTVFGLIFLKKTLVLKRMFATPTQPMTILTAQGTSRLIIAMLQTVLIVGVGVVAFHFYLPHGAVTFLEILTISAIGLVAFLGFGYFMAGLANDENSAGPLVNLVTLPQFLLSGTFFPTESLPTWLQPIANNLPLSYFNTAMRKVTTEGGHLVDTWPYLIGLLAWGAVMYILAAWTFKWE